MWQCFVLTCNIWFLEYYGALQTRSKHGTSLNLEFLILLTETIPSRLDTHILDS